MFEMQTEKAAFEYGYFYNLVLAINIFGNILYKKEKLLWKLTFKTRRGGDYLCLSLVDFPLAQGDKKIMNVHIFHKLYL